MLQLQTDRCVKHKMHLLEEFESVPLCMLDQCMHSICTVYVSIAQYMQAQYM